MNQKLASNQWVDAVRERSDLLAIASEYLSLNKTGQNYTGLCPFHQEKTASFVVNPVKQFYHCFGCGTGGDVFHFVSKIEGLSFPEALRSLAERGGVSLPTQDHPEAIAARSEAEEIFQVNEAATDYFHKNLIERSEGATALNYLKSRGLSHKTIDDFDLGYALPNWDHLLNSLGKRFSPALLEKAGLISRKSASVSSSKRTAFDRFRHRVIFPIRTLRGKIAGFGGRVLDDSMPKYLNTAETSVFTKGKILFGLHQAKGGSAHPLVIVEGYLDVITAFQAGIPNVVATLGTALTETHLGLIRRLSEKMILVFDGDEAGIRAAIRTVPLLLEQHLMADIVALPPGKDPDSYIQESGKEAFLQEMESSKPAIEFSILQGLKKTDLKSVADKMKVIAQTLPLIKQLKSQVEKSHYLKFLSEVLQIKEEDVRTEYIRLTKRAPMGVLGSKIPGDVKKTERLPEEQETVLKHLLQELLDPVALNGKLTLDDFTHPLIKKVITHYWNAQTSQWCKPECYIALEDEKSKALLSRLSVSEIDREQAKKAEIDCINVLCKKRFDQERGKKERQLLQTETGGNTPHAVQNKILEKILDLKRASSHLIPL